MEYMVSYQLRGFPSLCGNQTGTLEKVNEYIEANKSMWKSYAIFEIMPSNTFIHDLKLIRK